MTDKQTERQGPKCRCYINLKYYARVVRTGRGTLKGYKPCPIHNREEAKEDERLRREVRE